MAAGMSADQFKGLLNELYLTIGCKVYMIYNLKAELGLFNSSKGLVQDILYKKNADLTKDQPRFILAKPVYDKGVFPVASMKVMSGSK